MTQRPARGGMRTFTVVWFGQLISLIGSGLTGFALGVWVYQRTGSATQLALISLFATFPGIVVSPLGGALVDRWDRRWIMFVSDALAGVSTLVVALLMMTNQLAIWHIYLATAVSSVCSAFQWPAYSAATTLLVPKEQLGRTSGMVQLAQAAGRIFSPVLAGMLMASVQVHGVMFIDVATFLFALITLLTVRFPRPEATEEGAAGRGSLWHEAIYGWTYIKARAGLVGLLLLFVIVNFLVGTVTVLATPLVLAFASTAMLGTVLSIGGSGMLIGGLVMSIWGGLKRHIYSVFIFTMLCGFSLVLAGFRPSATLFAVAAFLFFFSLPMINAASQAIWQSKVAPDIQGRVFAVRGMIAWSSLPLAYLVAGPLADRVFEPLLVVNGPLASSFGRLIGVGPARGIGLLFMIMGSLTMLATIAGYLYPRLRLVENELPDAIAAESPTQVENEQLNRLSHPSQLEHVSE